MQAEQLIAFPWEDIMCISAFRPALWSPEARKLERKWGSESESPGEHGSGGGAQK
jgi:hypothetical protein